jgi:hypothetical protein
VRGDGVDLLETLDLGFSVSIRAPVIGTSAAEREQRLTARLKIA